MSKPKHKWYGVVKKLIMCDYYKGSSPQAEGLRNAMEAARQESEALPNSTLRLKAIDEILINKTKTYEGVGQEIHYDARTVQSWINSYINLVGKKAGF